MVKKSKKKVFVNLMSDTDLVHCRVPLPKPFVSQT